MSDSERNQMLPGVCVRVVNPDLDHRQYLDDFGEILDVKDYGELRFCQVELQQSRQAIFFETSELTLV